MAYFVKHTSNLNLVWSVNKGNLNGTDANVNVSYGRPLGPADFEAWKGATFLVGQMSRRSKQPPDITGAGTPWYFSKTVIDIITRLQPGPHDQFPVRFVDKRDGKDYGIHYAFYLPTYLDCIDVDLTQFNAGYGIEAARRSSFALRIGGKKPYVLKKKSITGWHIWRATRENASLTFISDELHDQLRASGAEGWTYLRCDLID